MENWICEDCKDVFAFSEGETPGCWACGSPNMKKAFNFVKGSFKKQERLLELFKARAPIQKEINSILNELNEERWAKLSIFGKFFYTLFPFLF